MGNDTENIKIFDKENFLAEVENYNKMCEAGEDTQFEKEPVFLYPIKEPPFYATKVEAVILVCVGGLKVNTDLAVVKEDGTPIDGLFATGNTSGDLYACLLYTSLGYYNNRATRTSPQAFRCQQRAQKGLL